MPETLERPPHREASSKPELVVQPSLLLDGKIRGLRRRHVTVAVFTGLAISLSVFVELLALEMFADWWIDLDWSVRLVLLIGLIGLVSGILFRLVLLPLVRRPDDDEVALIVEKACPQFRTRLIASLQLARPGAIPAGSSAALAEATVKQTEQVASSINFRSFVPTDRLLKFGVMALTVALIGILGLTAGQATVWDLLKRAFLSHTPVPRKTHISVRDGDKVVGIGDNLRLEAIVQGIVPANGKVEVKFRSRRVQEYPLEQDKENKIRFGRTIENVQESFTYVMSLGDGVSETFQVKAIPRPTVASMECEQEYPPYTRLKPAKRSLGDLALLAGSKISLHALATKPLKTASIKLVGAEGEFPMQIAEDKKTLTGEFSIPAKGLTGFSIQMLDMDDMESRDSAVYRIDLIPDKPPVARITYPDRKEELITRQATMIVGIEASDDFEITKLRLKYRITEPASDLPGAEVQTDEVANPSEKVVELDLEGKTPQRLRRRHEWKIGEFRPLLPEGATIEYWVEVEDNNNVTGPGIGTSEHQLAKVVSESDKRADLLNRAGDYLGSISDVATDQEKLNKNLGTLIREKAEKR